MIDEYILSTSIRYCYFTVFAKRGAFLRVKLCKAWYCCSISVRLSVCPYVRPVSCQNG